MFSSYKVIWSLAVALPWLWSLLPWSWDSSLALAMVVVLALRSLDLLILFNHNHYIVTWVFKIAVKKLKKISFIMGFLDPCSWVFEENIVPENFRALTFWWNGAERPLFACFNSVTETLGQFCRKILVTSISHIFWLIYSF